MMLQLIQSIPPRRLILLIILTLWIYDTWEDMRRERRQITRERNLLRAERCGSGWVVPPARRRFFEESR